MSDVRRFPDDSHAWWWRRGLWAPIRVRMYCGMVQHYDSKTGSWHDLSAGEYLPCPAPEWPPHPPPRPRMVYGASDGPPGWFVAYTQSTTHAPWYGYCGDEYGWCWVDADEIDPHDHPEQSAEESRRILDAEKNS